MSAARILGGAALIAVAGIVAYTVQGAISTVWGVSQFNEMPITVKLFLPVILGTLTAVLAAMGLIHLRRRGQPQVNRAAETPHDG